MSDAFDLDGWAKIIGREDVAKVMAGIPAVIAEAQAPLDMYDDGNAPPPWEDPEFIAEMQAAETSLTGPAVHPLAQKLAAAVERQYVQQMAQRLLIDRSAAQAQRLDRAHVVNARDFLAETPKPAAQLLGDLAHDGHNVVMTAQYKSGKTTLIVNGIKALVSGGLFLGRFAAHHPRVWPC